MKAIGRLMHGLFQLIRVDYRQGEARRILLLHGQFILVVFVLVLARSLRDALFVSREGIGSLPWMYVGTGILVPLTTWVYIRLQAQRPPWQTAPWVHLALAAGTALIGLLVAADVTWSITSFYLWVEVIVVVSVVHFWNVANAEFHPRQARRLYGFIAAGQATGNLLSGTFIHFATDYVGTSAILVTLTTLCAASGLVYYSSRNLSTAGFFVQSEPPLPKGEDHVRYEHSYGRLLLLLTGATYIVCALVDFQFKVIAARSYTETELIQFFGFFYATVGLIGAIIQFAFYRHMINFMGIFMSLTLMPVLFLTGGLILPFLPILMVSSLLKLGESSFRYSLHEPVSQSLYLPLRPLLRARLQSVAGGYVKPLAISSAGVLLVLLRPDQFSGLRTEQLGFPIGVGALVVLLIVERLRSGYLSVLAADSALIAARPEAPEIPVFDHAKTKVLLQATQTASPAALTGILLRVELPDPETRINFTVAAMDRSDVSYRLRSRFLLKLTQEEAIGACALPPISDPYLETLLQVSAGRRPWRDLMDYSDIRKSDLLEGLLRSLFSLNIREAAIEAHHSLFLFLEGKRDTDQLISLYMSEFIPEAERFELMFSALTGGNRKLVPAALRMIARHPNPDLVPLVLTHLPDPEFRGLAQRAVICCGAKGLETSLDVMGSDRSHLWHSFGSSWGRYVQSISLTPAVGHRLLDQMVVEEKDPFYWPEYPLFDLPIHSKGTEEMIWDKLAVWLAAWRQTEKNVDDHCFILLHREAHIRLLKTSQTLLGMLFSRSKLPLIDRINLASAPLWTDAKVRANIAEIAEQYLPRLEANRLLRFLESDAVGSLDGSKAFRDATSPLPEVARRVLHSNPPQNERKYKMSLTDTDPIETVLTLSRLPLFQELTADDLARIADLAEVRNYDVGAPMSTPDEQNASLLVLLHGKAKITDSDNTVREVGPMTILGDLGVLYEPSRGTTVEAMEQVRALRIDHKRFESLLDSFPHIARSILRQIVDHLHENRESVEI